jgi:hypothetical protein
MGKPKSFRKTGRRNKTKRMKYIKRGGSNTELIDACKQNDINKVKKIFGFFTKFFTKKK